MTERPPAPDWDVERWFNSKQSPALADFRGRVLFVLAFQMLCPGCVQTALPQAKQLRATFTREDLGVVAIHTVFEHHAAQGTAAALEAFLHEYQIGFPVGIDAGARPGRLPSTMGRYGMQGTPTMLLVDHQGGLALNHFGHLDDMALGAVVGSLIAEKNAAAAPRNADGGA